MDMVVLQGSLLCGGRTIGEQKANCQEGFCEFSMTCPLREKAAAGRPDKVFGINRTPK
jgi:hypothetical protein